MNTKNILKTLALAVVLTSACNKSEVANDENIAEKGYTLPVTINVTRQGDDATKATFDDDTKKLSFSEGDKLFVNGYYNTDKRFVGTLSYASDGKFSGTISTQDKWTGTAEDLLEAGEDVQAYLLPAGYESYGFVSIEEHVDPHWDDCVYDYTKAFALTKAAGVEQLSREYTSSYASGFALAPKNAILNFKIIGLSASKVVTVSFTFTITKLGEEDSIVTINENVTTDASGNAIFAIGVPAGVSAGSTDFKDCALTVDGNTITLGNGSSTPLVAGKIYNITRTITVTWDSSNVFNEAHKDDLIAPTTPDTPDYLTYAGITITRSGSNPIFMAYHPDEHKGKLNLLTAGDSFSFTVPLGKKFSKIEIINKDDKMGVADVNWSTEGYKAMWQGTPSSTVTIGSGDGMTYFDNLDSIVFTLCY